MNTIIKLDSSVQARNKLSALGWIAQPVSGAVLEVTGHFFVQAGRVTLSYGIDTVASWIDAIPRIVEVQGRPNSVTTVNLSPNGVIYSAVGVQVSAAGVLPGAATSIIAGAAVIPPMLGSSGFLFAQLQPFNAASLTPNAAHHDPLNPPLWLYKSTPDFSNKTDTEGQMVAGFDPFAASTFVPSSSIRTYPPIGWPMNRTQSNRNTLSTMTGGFTNANAAFAVGANIPLIPFYSPGSASPGTNRKPWIIYGRTTSMTGPSNGLCLAFCEIPILTSPLRSIVGGTAATVNASQIVRLLYCPIQQDFNAGCNYIAACYAPLWEPAAGNSVVATVFSDNSTTPTGFMLGTYGAVTPGGSVQPASSTVMALY